MNDESVAASEVSRDSNVVANSSRTCSTSDASVCVNASSTVQNDSAATDATGISTDSAMSSSAYDAMQQYSEAEIHGEYEAQYFGFTADSVADGLYNAVIQHMWEAVSSVKDIMQKKFPTQITDEQSERIGTKLMGKFQDTVDKAFDKLAIYLKTNIFKIPGNVVLPEDKVQLDYKYTAEEEAALDKEIEDLEAAINNSKYMNACLRQEIKDNSSLLDEMEQVMNHLSSVEDAFLQAGVGNMKDTFKAIRNRINELKEIVETIQPINEPPAKKNRLLET